ncbi:diacylglycerol/lipid kinase family protein [Chromatocurvus halotolerans]|uniref:Diacylglycerol kinase family enzyme n=1 Tax=Chromatocurvus halotolerans TaxID=1132028 RepID=A0A4R2KI33_9GAMM|nr:diacylglycerol kinase family protein [Chromatocurvus halotolerans]TCO69658.1 diacylglycerol kinase family enzyme [Chromatocurvus halotolerans]
MTDAASDTTELDPTTLLSGTEPLFLVMNSASGSLDGHETRSTIERVLSESGKSYELMQVNTGSQLVETARRAVDLAREQSGIVVAVGGDGTLNAVANEVLGKDVPMGILPQGTFNYFGRMYGIPQDTEAALACLLDAVIRPVDVGLLNSHVFLVNASIGLYPQLLEDRETYKRRYGRSRPVALWSALVTLMRAHRSLHLQIDLEGKPRRDVHTPALVVDNNALQLKHMGIDRVGDIERHHLVAMTSRSRGTLALYGLLIRGLLSRLGDAENVESFSFDTMTVQPRRGRARMKVAMDGEITRMSAPLEFRISPDKLPLLVPRDPAMEEHP